jgi:hypothetical protein
MPLFQYFGWVGSFLLAALLAANWCSPAPIGPTPASRVPLNRSINIRIHTDHKWPERVVFDTTRPKLAPETKVNAETDIAPSEILARPERLPFEAFAEMAAAPIRPCFRPPSSAGHAAERETSPIEKGAASQKRSRLSITARKSFTFPNPLHKPPGRS